MNKNSYNKLLSFEFTKTNLMVAAVYLTAYELVKYSIIEQIKNFYLGTEATGENEMLRQYKKEVLTLDKSIFIASCLWLEKMEAISDIETQEILNTRKHRHEVAHKLPEFIIDDNVNINIKYLFKLQEILMKIDIWWIKEVELAINPDYANANKEVLNVKSGSMLLLEHLITILKSDKNLNNKKEYF